MDTRTKIKSVSKQVHYPESDGKPLAENTIQLKWIFSFYMNLRLLLRNQMVFIASDLFWYPVKGNNQIKTAPDVLVAFGRPDGDRGSYKQWEEEDIAPQVVIEVLSPGNTPIEMARKLAFYQKYGVEEYIMLDPEKEEFFVYLRRGDQLSSIDESSPKWQSPKLKIWLEIIEGKLTALLPDMKPFVSFEGLSDQVEGLSDQVEGLSDQLEGLSDQVENLSDQVETLSNRAKQTQEALDLEKRKTKEAEDEISRLKAQLKDLKNTEE